LAIPRVKTLITIVCVLFELTEMSMVLTLLKMLKAEFNLFGIMEVICGNLKFTYLTHYVVMIATKNKIKSTYVLI
jgi:hypothetical protein